MPAAELKKRWRNGEVTYGATIKLGSPWMAEVLAVSGFDFIKIDLQHGINFESSLLPMFQAMRGTDVTPLVKIPEIDPVVIGRVLDWGAEGITVPDVATPEDAQRAVAATRHPPEGIRSNSAFRLKYLPGGMLRETICVATIESKVGAQNAAAIAALPGIDGITIGPGDLALDLGLPPVEGHAIRPGPHADAINAIIKACKENGVACGMTGDSGGKELKELGMQIISLGADAAFFEAGMKAALAKR